MNSFLNPLMNPNLGAYPMHDPDVDAEAMNQFEGRMGEIWSKDNLINSLNHLIRVCRDGQEGYLQAAEHVKSAWLQGLFQQFSTQREQFATELTNLVASLGEEPASGATVAGALHRTWIDFRTAVSGDGRDDAAVLDECERGEDTAKEAYETELNKGLPDHIDRVVQSQYLDILRSHDQVLEARDAFAH